MDKKWKASIGVCLVIVGLVVSWKSYITINQCNSFVGKFSTFISSLFGGNAAQTCYNANIIVVAGVIVAIFGLGVIYLALKGAKGKRR
jgi:hypothetical protein